MIEQESKWLLDGIAKIVIQSDRMELYYKTAEKLISKGFYDGIIFHRIIKDFMAQTGDPDGTGTGGPGYTIDDEFVSSLRHDKKGLC